MKSMVCAPVCIILLAAVTIFSSCKKGREPYDPAVQGYLLHTLKVNDGFSTDSVLFSYNHAGDPVSAIRGQTATGAPDYYFLYDKKGRLSDYYGRYKQSPGSFEVWFSFQYDQHDRPIGDSLFWFGDISPDNHPVPTPDHPSSFLIVATTYQYDNYNRIIKTVETIDPSDVTTRNYHYNVQGDLVSVLIQATGRPDITYTYTYDNKINPHRLNPIWQLIDKDFSLHNPLPVAAYTKQGFPSSVGSSHDYQSFLRYEYAHLDLTYVRK